MLKITENYIIKEMQVLKFGGTSVGSTANIEKVSKIVFRALEQDKTIVVASAFAGVTNSLIELGKMAASRLKEETGRPKYEKIIEALEHNHFSTISELIPVDYRAGVTERLKGYFNELRSLCSGVYSLKELSPSTLDTIMSFGELCSTKILAAKFASMGAGCKWVDSRELIKTHLIISQNSVETKVTYKKINDYFSDIQGKLFVMPGFIARDLNGRSTTLGRGGSDYTASIVAAGVKARILEIWTDVSGMMTADPRIVPEAKTIKHISYKEALELSHFGAKVVYPPTIQPVIKLGLPIAVKNTFSPDDFGTLIEATPPESEDNVKGLSGSDNLAIISMEGSGMVGIPGYSSRLFDILYKNEINIILITQASSVHTMLIAIEEKDADIAKKAVDELFAYEISLGKIEPLKVETGFSIISLVGDNMKNQSGASGRMFEALGRKGITIRAIAQGSSERNVSTVVKTEEMPEAVRAIHEEFFSHAPRTINLFIAGFGNVGKELIKIIGSTKNDLLRREKSELRITGLCNSRKMVYCLSGIEAKEAGELLNNGESYNMETFADKIRSCSCGENIFVDCTSSNDLASLYSDILSSGCNIVTANKIANSSGYRTYVKIRESAVKGRAKFLYDTNVGAALPILYTLREMANSGDKILKIEAIVSGSLNYIFSKYCANQELTFAEVVEEAKRLGYTEPEPKTDLCGIDVLRKAVIMAREIGYSVEQESVVIETPIPPEEEYESYFSKLRERALKNGSKLRYMSTISDGSVFIGLKEITPGHPFYNSTGSDAAASITTERYPSPVVICGAGAGGAITASGLFNNILSLL